MRKTDNILIFCLSFLVRLTTITFLQENLVTMICLNHIVINSMYFKSTLYYLKKMDLVICHVHLIPVKKISSHEFYGKNDIFQS